MPQLDISTFPSQIFWLLVCFSVLCFAMVTFLIPRLSKIMESRTQELENLKAQAEKILAEADALSNRNSQTFDEAKHQVHSQLAQMMADLTKLRDQRIHAFEEHIHQQTQIHNQKLDADRQEILAKSKEILTHLTDDILKKLNVYPVKSTSSQGH